MHEGRRTHMPAVGIMTLMETATKCCTEKTMMEIYYLKKDFRGQERYEVEPYEIKGGFLWAFDPKADTVKRFKIDGIVAIADTQRAWEVDASHERSKFERKLLRRQDERTSTDQGSENVGTVHEENGATEASSTG